MEEAAKPGAGPPEDLHSDFGLSLARSSAVGGADGLHAWAQEKSAELGAKNYTAGDPGPYALMGLSAFWMGDFAAVDEVLAIAADLAGDGPWPDDVAARVVLQRSLAGVVSSLRGLTDHAELQFAEALGPQGGTEVTAARVIAYSMRAALASEGKPERALEDVAHARRLAREIDIPELSAITAIGEGWAFSELGNLEDAASILLIASSELSGDLERSVAQLRLAEVQLRLGNRAAARATVDAARETFVNAEARYWAARAVLLTGAIDRDRGGRWLKLARDLSLPDLAYERLFLPEGTLRIDLTAQTPVRRDGESVAFLTRHAETAVRLLAASGQSGLSSKELSEIFWPGISAERQSARLRTLLWQARNSLGADAWRVQRKRDIVVFDATGVELVGTITTSEIVDEFQSRKLPPR